MGRTLGEMEVSKQLVDAPQKAIFLVADPKLIAYQEAMKLPHVNTGDPDSLLQGVRDSFR